jgi:hypothetical protein
MAIMATTAVKAPVASTLRSTGEEAAPLKWLNVDGEALGLSLISAETSVPISWLGELVCEGDVVSSVKVAVAVEVEVRCILPSSTRLLGSAALLDRTTGPWPRPI